MTLAIERIVVQIAPTEKRKIEAKSKKLGISLSELMRRASTTYSGKEEDAELIVLADAAKQAADNAMASIDDALSFIAASNKRIAKMEANTAHKVAA